LRNFLGEEEISFRLPSHFFSLEVPGFGEIFPILRGGTRFKKTGEFKPFREFTQSRGILPNMCRRLFSHGTKICAAYLV